MGNFSEAVQGKVDPKAEKFLIDTDGLTSRYSG